jgi:hypothetical protein
METILSYANARLANFEVLGPLSTCATEPYSRCRLGLKP